MYSYGGINDLKNTTERTLIIEYMSDICEKEKCAHYIGADKLKFNRGRFLWTMIIFSVATLGVLWFIIDQNSKSVKQIVESQQSYYSNLQGSLPEIKLTKDSCVYLNEQLVSTIDMEMSKVSSMLELHLSQQHAYFTILSVWAGIMMIVFLVFSLYSMYKTDELHKQSKEGVRAIEEKKGDADAIIGTIRQNASTEIENVQREAESQIANIQKASQDSIVVLEKNVGEEQEKLYRRISKMGDEFEGVYKQYTQKLEDAQKTSNELMQIFMKMSQTGLSYDEGGLEPKTDSQNSK